jgi:hypothetical protein
MAHRQPHLKDQVRLVRQALASRNIDGLSQGACQELVAQLNGHPSWNVAKAKEGKPVSVAAPEGVATTIEFELWTAVHHHRHGEDFYFFRYCPSEAEVIAEVDATSSWEPEDDESVEVRGVEKFIIDIPLEMAKAAAKRQPSLVGVHEVCMTDYFEYDTPDTVPEWQWVEQNARFSHKGNGIEGGVWEFMIHLEALQVAETPIPEKLQEHIDRASALGAVWVMFYQG